MHVNLWNIDGDTEDDEEDTAGGEGRSSLERMKDGSVSLNSYQDNRVDAPSDRDVLQEQTDSQSVIKLQSS